MRLSVTLEDENRNVMEALDDMLVLKAGIDLRGFKLLGYLDPYGDTVFNRNQLADLVADLHQLGELAESPVISQIISLADKCKNEVHTYLCFNGD